MRAPFFYFLIPSDWERGGEKEEKRRKGVGRGEDGKGGGESAKEGKKGGGGGGEGARRSAEMKDSSDGTVSLGTDTYEKQTSRRG